MRVLNQRGDNRKAGITWGQEVGNAECPYMKRWVLNFGVGSIRLHRWYHGDDPRHLHDHPWPFVTFVLRGGYTDVSAQADGTVKQDVLLAPTWRYRSAEYAHSVLGPLPNTWTLVVTRKHMRDWGFHTPEGWLRMRRFFKVYGHHPCED